MVCQQIKTVIFLSVWWQCLLCSPLQICAVLCHCDRVKNVPQQSLGWEATRAAQGMRSKHEPCVQGWKTEIEVRKHRCEVPDLYWHKQCSSTGTAVFTLNNLQDYTFNLFFFFNFICKCLLLSKRGEGKEWRNRKCVCSATDPRTEKVVWESG